MYITHNLFQIVSLLGTKETKKTAEDGTLRKNNRLLEEINGACNIHGEKWTDDILGQYPSLEYWWEGETAGRKR